MKPDYPDIDIAPFIDHALLTPTAMPGQVEQWCEEADRFQFAAVCVYPAYVRTVAELLRGKQPKVCTVIGFPSGATTSAVKLYEAGDAVENGATELDVVINLSWLKTGKTEELHREIAAICEETGQTVKAILETTLLTDAEKRMYGCRGGVFENQYRLEWGCNGGRCDIAPRGGTRACGH